jgi:AraC-like DNA-binding protein
MSYREHAPPPALAASVDRLWTSDAAPSSGEPRRILPDGCIDLLVELDGDSVLARVVGTMTRAVLVPASVQHRVVAVRFRPGGASGVVRIDADELTDREVSARDLGLDLAIDPRDPLASLVAWLHARAGSVADPAVAHAIARLLEPASSIAELARDTGWSRQYLARACRRRVGVSPKQLARVARMQRTTIAIQRARGTSTLAAAAAANGYFDQAHMAKDFRELAGVTPREAVSIFPIRSLYGAP